ncbi:amidohydrolase family protein [Acinetobacter guillouiae]|uniref:amidohydrolase family protein n=1 Tax=Acinetobacter guillouiae TaxID=106649 RepID=UPI002FDA85A4
MGKILKYNLPCAPAQDEYDKCTFKVPFGAVDTHAHVISDSSLYPFVNNRSYTPPPAPVSKYLKMLDELQMSFGVLIQISVYGTDNSYMLEVLKKYPNKLRGVAVVSPEITDKELESMHQLGIRGLRINVLFGGGVSLAVMEKLADRIKDFGWHLEFLLDARDLPELMPKLIKLPVTGVIDHIGHFPVEAGLNNEGFTSLRRLVTDHDYWVKLSGAYRISNKSETYQDVKPFAQTLISDSPEHMLWGSDWPHVSQSETPNSGKLLNLLKDWAPDQETRNRILVSNPGFLYDFK